MPPALSICGSPSSRGAAPTPPRCARIWRGRTKETFELSPDIVILEPGVLAGEFESSVKAPRFIDRRR